MPLRCLLLVLLLASAPQTAQAAGIGISIPLFEAVGYSPDRGVQSTSRPAALNVAFPIKKNVAVGVAIDAYVAEFDRDTRGKDLRDSFALPVGFLAQYYPLEGKFNPYFMGQIGPVFLHENAEDDAGATSSGFHVGPHLGFGVGAAMRWPVTPLAEFRCIGAFPAGEYITNMYVCGVTAGLAVSF